MGDSRKMPLGAVQIFQGPIKMLSASTTAALRAAGIEAFEHLLAAANERDLRRLPGIGPRRLAEIEALLGTSRLLGPKSDKQLIAEILRRYLSVALADEAAGKVMEKLQRCASRRRDQTTRKADLSVAPAGPTPSAGLKPG